MQTILFDGYQLATRREQTLAAQVQQLADQGRHLTIGAILFAEDAGSQLYTRLKHEAAERVGIGYEVETFSMLAPVADVVAQIQTFNLSKDITGIIIQKPWRQTWLDVTGRGNVSKDQARQEFDDWWNELVQAIDLTKDVDGLHPDQRRLMPATAKAVITIAQEASQALGRDLLGGQSKWVVVGISDLLGRPLARWLRQQGIPADLIGSVGLQKRIDSGVKLTDVDVIVTATGRGNLITGDLVHEGAVVIDAGEPRPDADRASLTGHAAFLTPVPGGVGPLTVVSLLENCLELVGVER